MTRRLELSEAERETLEQAVRHHPKAYARERAAALVKVADRVPAARVARQGLLARRKPDTVYRWLDAYEAHGLAVLTIRAGRGRKPRLSPPGEAARAEQRAGLLELLADDPARHGQARSGWTLAGLREAVPAFAGASPSGIWRVLARHRLRRKRARDHLRSPDPAYREKVAHLAGIRARVAADPGHAVLLYLDELTYHRQPSHGYGYAPVGSTDPRAERSTRRDDPTRVVGALDHATGRVVAHQQGRIGVPALRRFYRALVAAYPGRRIHLVLDNWPVHYHPDLLAALEPQASPFPFPRPPSWPTDPAPDAPRLDLPIQLVPLPTYASWLNPIEKLRRKLKQDVLHLHRLAHDLPALRARVRAFLDRFRRDSPDLRRYVGLAKRPR